ncbi:hypothetical protein K501DRAFT_302148 [Backusella circina FSU 941]|nr:hypothetical protein K501DRAFT_302148 [Backusella circina FSU 941]
MFNFFKKAIASIFNFHNLQQVCPPHLFRELPVGHIERVLEEISVPPKERFVFVNDLNNDDPDINLKEEHEVDGFVVYDNLIKGGGHLCDIPKLKSKIKSNRLANFTPRFIKRLRLFIYDAMEYRYKFYPTIPNMFIHTLELKEEPFVITANTQKISAQQQQDDIDQMIKKHSEKYPYEAAVVRGLSDDYDALKKFVSWK